MKEDVIFRAYDIRGIYGKDLTEEIVHDIGRAFSTFIGYGKKICLGRDTRNSGATLLESFLAGLTEAGCCAVKAGIIPIPVLGFLTWHRNYDMGVYISASHNPPEYNGIRFRGKDGAGYMDGEGEIKRIFMEKKFRKISFKEKRKLYVADYDNNLLLEEYFSFIVERVNLQKEMSIVVDPGNGSACKMLPLYEKIGCRAYGINTYPDGDFPGRGPNPNEKSLSQTASFLKKIEADFAVAFDADADRGIILDDKGRLVPPEKIAVIIARHAGVKGKIVASMDCSILLEKELSKEGIEVVREKVGDVFISKAVKRHNAIIGVERSGHFFIPSFHFSDDPFAMSSKLAEILSQSKEKLSSLVDNIPEYTYYSEYFECPENIKFDVMEKLKEEMSKLEYEINLKDGVRISTDDWMVLIRASNTEPLIRMYIETSIDNLDELKEAYKKKITDAIKSLKQRI